MSSIKDTLIMFIVLVLLVSIVMAGFFAYYDVTDTPMNPEVLKVLDGTGAVLINGAIAWVIGLFLPFIKMTVSGYFFPLMKWGMLDNISNDSPLLNYLTISNMDASFLFTFWPKDLDEPVFPVLVKVTIALAVMLLIPYAVVKFIIGTMTDPIWAKWVGGILGTLFGIGLGVMAKEELA